MCMIVEKFCIRVSRKKVEMMGVRDWKQGFESERGKEYVNKKGVPEEVGGWICGC